MVREKLRDSLRESVSDKALNNVRTKARRKQSGVWEHGKNSMNLLCCDFQMLHSFVQKFPSRCGHDISHCQCEKDVRGHRVISIFYRENLTPAFVLLYRRKTESFCEQPLRGSASLIHRL
jgi:hypothetical protein